jgi:protease IV
MAISNNREHSFIVRLAMSLWRALSWLRTALLNLLLLFILIAIGVAVLSPKQAPLPDRAPLLLSPSGILVDQYSYISPGASLLAMNGEGKAETLVRELVETVNRAATDERITGLLLGLDDLQGGGISKMQEVGQALERFRAAGKPVVAFADNYGQEQYFLASYADEIYLHDMGGVALTGFGFYRQYFKDALDKLSIGFHVFKVGEFKDFVEPFTRNDMSDASREHNRQWLDTLWFTYTEQVERRRQLDPGSLTQLINNMADRLAEVQGNPAQLALQQRLVDHLGSRQTRNRTLIERFGAREDEPETVLHITADDYNRHATEHRLKAEGNIALVVASGIILDGEQPEGTIGGDSLATLIRRARQDEAIKALVLRVDSGGGSAFASEIIRQELELTRDAGKPVVVSMGGMAASGGYWIAMSSDEVWATPSTITGSIGVFGLLPNLAAGLNKLGVHTDGFGTTELASAMRPDLPLSPEVAQVTQQGIDHIYARFLQIVAANRGTQSEKIHPVAQGRVWIGAKALELGLVDQLGYLDDAVAAAAARAGLADYEVRLIERDLTRQEQFLRQLMGNTTARLGVRALVDRILGTEASLLVDIGGMLREQTSKLPTKGAAYAWCLECLSP